MQISGVEVDPHDLAHREDELRARSGKMRMRDVSTSLKVPEAALLEVRSTRGEARRITRLMDDEASFKPILERIGDAGEVMALTRNEHCVHEKHGTYTSPQFYGAMGQVVGEIDLRLFLQHWHYGYCLEEKLEGDRTRLSLQFFDGCGDAIHKIYATSATDHAAFQQLAQVFHDAAPDAPVFDTRPPAADEKPDAEIDIAGLRSGWASLEHSHEFYGLLKRFEVTRHQAMRLGGSDYARPVSAHAMKTVLETCSERQIPMMIFVGNEGCVQIHAGPVERIETMGPWLNVLDPRFNLHLREDRVAAAYVVRKPSARGDIHSLELFDEHGLCFVQAFGERKPGESEREDWREVLGRL
ncbi:MAG: ChuX/HutX family heme-like substrate-binding protein [Pseudomonadota bacterium]